MMSNGTRPTSGSCFFRDSDLVAASDADVTQYRRLHVGNLIASLTAEENVDLVAEVATNPMPSRETLELVGLGTRTHHFPKCRSRNPMDVSELSLRV